MTVGESIRNNPATAGTWLLNILSGALIIIVAAVAMYVVTSINRYGQDLAAMKRDISWIRLGISDVYTKDDAQQKHEQIFRTDQDQYNLIRGLEERVEVLEKQIK